MLELVPSAQRPRAAPMGGGIFNEAGVQTLLIVAEAFAAHLRAVSRSRRNEECKERPKSKMLGAGIADATASEQFDAEANLRCCALRSIARLYVPVTVKVMRRRPK